LFLTRGNSEQNKSVRFDPDYQAVITRAISLGYTLPSFTQQVRQNSLMLALKHAGIFYLLDALYIFANDGSKEFGTINWKSATTAQATITGSPTWTSNQGFGSVGTNTDYITTGTITFANYTQNTASWGWYQHTGLVTSDKVLLSGTLSNTSIVAYDNSVNQATARCNQSALTNTAFNTEQNFQSSSFYSINRTAAASLTTYKNGVSQTVSTQASVSVTATDAIRFFAINGFEYPSGGKVGMFFCGGGSISQALIYNAYNEYQTNIASSSPYTTEYQTILDRASTLGYTQPTQKEKLNQNQLVYDMKVANIWGQLDVFYNYWVHDSDFATINWKTPASFQASKVNNPTFTRNAGFAGNGTSSYINTNWTPSTNAVNYTLNSASMFVHANTTLSAGVLAGARNSSGSLELYFTSGSYNINASAGGSHTADGGVGLRMLQRSSSTARAIFKNGVSITTSSQASTGLPNRAVLVGALNESPSITNYTTTQVSCFGAGASLASLEYKLYAIWDTYQALTKEIDSSYKLVLDKATQSGYAKPTHAQQIKHSNLIKGLKYHNIWNSLDVFYNFMNDSNSSFATLNWKNPFLYQVTMVNSPSFTVNQGFLSNGTTSYLNSGWAPTNGVNYTLTDASIFHYTPTNNLSNQVDWGADSAGAEITEFNCFANAIINGLGVTASPAPTTTNGLHHISRNGTAVKWLRNGVFTYTATNTATARASANVFILCRNNGANSPANYTIRRNYITGAGSSLTGKEAALYTVINDFVSNP
jgi:hypothetical protein